jgi:hypothetical protein
MSPEVKLLKNPFSQRDWGLAMAEAANGMIMKHQDASELCKRVRMKAGNTDTSWNRTIQNGCCRRPELGIPSFLNPLLLYQIGIS